MMLKGAVIGLGPHGHRIIRAIRNVDGLSLAAVIDKSAPALSDERIPKSAVRCDDFETALATHDIDVLCIATNGPSHADLAVRAIEAGVRFVLVEKPMACSLVSCDRIVAAAKTHGAKVAVDHPRRYTRAYRHAREAIASGRWGKARAMWIQRPGIGLGCLATHSFDLARFVLSSEIARVTAWVDDPIKSNPRGAQFVDPGGLVVLEMANGARCVVAQIEDGAGPMHVEIDLTAARVRLDEKAKRYEVVARDLTVKKGPGKPAAYEWNDAPDDVGLDRSLVDEISALLEDLIDGPDVAADGVDGTASIEALVAAHLSHERGHVPVSLPLVDAQSREKWLPVT